MACFGNCALLLLSVVLTGTLGYSVNQEDLKRLATANNDMALNIYRLLADQTKKNIIFSPMSLSTAFGMSYYGTRGNTAQELRKALGYDKADLPYDLMHQAFQTYFNESLSSQDTSAYVLNSANAIFLDKGLQLVPSYKSDVQCLYRATVQDVDFVTEADRIVSEINNWVKDKTSGKIDKLLTNLDPLSAALIVNAIYFKGTWKIQFDPRNTFPQTFYNYGVYHRAKEVPMMVMEDNFPYSFESDFQAVELPYKGENVSMVILLPNETSSLRSFERNLTLKKLSTIRQQLNKTKVHLTIPKFRMQYSKEMSTEFKTLGARSIFIPGGDFSGICSYPSTFVSEVVHKAVIEDNEEGSETAAATAIVSTRTPARALIQRTTRALTERTEIIFNRPFLIVITNTTSDKILFMAYVTSP